MEVKELVIVIHIVELSATTRSSAIRELVDAVNWASENVLPDNVVKAIEDREATAQTIVDKGLALPRAMIEWTGDFRMVLGRSQPVHGNGHLISRRRRRTRAGASDIDAVVGEMSKAPASPTEGTES